MSLDWASIVGSAAGGTVVLGGAGALISKALRRLISDVVRIGTEMALKDLQADVTALKVQIAAEVGGNSNGLRQKLDLVATDVAHLKGAADAVAQLAQTHGRHESDAP